MIWRWNNAAKFCVCMWDVCRYAWFAWEGFVWVQLKMTSRVKGHFDGLLCFPEPHISCIQSSNYDPCLQVLRFRGWNREPITNKNSWFWKEIPCISLGPKLWTITSSLIHCMKGWGLKELQLQFFMGTLFQEPIV